MKRSGIGRKASVGGLVASALVVGLLYSCVEDRKVSTTPTSNLFQKLPEKVAISFEGEPKAVLLKIDKKQGKVETIERTFKTGVFHQIMFSPDGKYVFIADSGNGQIIVLDGNNFDVIKKIKVGLWPTHIDISEDGKILAVANEESNSVSFISVEKLEVVAEVADKSLATPHFARNSGHYWFVANADANRITVIDSRTWKVVKNISVPDLPEDCSKWNGECGFFDVGIKKDANLGAGVHSATGKFITFTLDKLQVLKSGKINFELDYLNAKVPVFSANRIFIPFAKGVFVFNFVASEKAGLWIYEPDTYRADTGSELGDGVVVPMFDEGKIAFVDHDGKLKAIFEVGGHPQMNARYNDVVLVVVAYGKGEGSEPNLAKVVGISSDGKMFEVISGIEGNLVHGIHVPGAWARCH